MDNIIKGFEWYLPLAFKNSVAQCKFEQGDVIYRHRPKGTIWGEEIKHIDFLVQVKSPTRTNSSAVGDLDVFGSIWNSKIVFEKIYPNNHSRNKTIETTQGKFFSFLWTNDEAVFTSDNLTLPDFLPLWVFPITTLPHHRSWCFHHQPMMGFNYQPPTLKM